jgi:hypothetical protein
MPTDLRRWENCIKATEGVDEVYALAADMGGMGFISSHHAEILHNNSLINIHTLEAARLNNVKKYLYTSSACVYPEYKQTETNVTPLKEDDAYPAQPQDAYGWESSSLSAFVPITVKNMASRPDCPLSQYFWATRDLGGRPRKGAGRAMPQNCCCEADRKPRDRGLGRR